MYNLKAAERRCLVWQDAVQVLRRKRPLQAQRKRSNAWVKKLIIAFLFLFFVFWDCGYIVLPQLKQAFDFIGISGFVIYMFYVF